MSSAYLKSKIEERTGLAEAMTAVLDRCAEKATEPSTEERANLDKWGGQVKVLDAEIAELETRFNADRRFEGVLNRMADGEEKAERRAALEERKAPAPVSFGEAFVQSEEFKAYRGRGTMEPVEFEGFLETRAAISLDTLDLPPAMWEGPRPYRTTTPLLDVLGRERTTQNSVEWISWGTADPLAGGPIAEGELKPEADIVPSENVITLATYAHWKAITRQALEDYPRIRSIVEGKLRGGLASKLEQVAMSTLTAAGTGIPEVAGDDLLSGIRIAIGEIQADGYQPNAVLLNPADYAALDISAAAASNSGPQAFGNFWGLRPVAVGALPEGTVYVGDFANGMTWFDRNTTSVYMTDSHADYFVRNLLVVLAEQRAAFAVTDAQAIAKVTATEAVAAPAAKK